MLPSCRAAQRGDSSFKPPIGIQKGDGSRSGPGRYKLIAVTGFESLHETASPQTGLHHSRANLGVGKSLEMIGRTGANKGGVANEGVF